MLLGYITLLSMRTSSFFKYCTKCCRKLALRSIHKIERMDFRTQIALKWVDELSYGGLKKYIFATFLDDLVHMAFQVRL